MRKIREVLRLKFEVGLSARQVAVSLQVGRASVGEYLNRFAASGLTWPSVLTDAELQRRLFPRRPPFPAISVRIWTGLMSMLSYVAPASLWPCFGKSIDSPIRKLSVQLVLRALPPLGRQDLRGHAPGTSCRRKVVCLLRRPDRAGH